MTKPMKLSLILLLATCFLTHAATEEHISKRFTVTAGGTLVVNVDFGSIDVSTNDTSEVVVDVLRKVTRATKDEEEAFLADRPVEFSQEGNTLTILSQAASKNTGASRGPQRTEGKYTITVPAQFAAQLKTGGGTVAVNDLTGDVNAASNGGGLQFARLHGPLDGKTTGGPIQVTGCEGTQQVKTTGGRIDVSGGAGSFDGKTSGGPVTVKDFRGSVQVKSSGGPIDIENVTGKVDGKTSGGAISAQFASPLSEDVSLVTSGGGVTLRVPENSAFDLDASTTGGSVSSELSVDTTDKPSRNHLRGPVNGGGKTVTLHTGGGSIQVRKP
jgi:DUF4097 and DUF4098 domain-containing protein YvlB